MKRNFLRIFLILIAITIVAIGGLLGYVKTALPNVGAAPDIHIAGTPEQIARGHYLANYVMQCLECHSERNWNVFAGPMIPGTEGKGGEAFTQELGFPGSYIAANITPAGIGDWTDGELFRAITSGVSKDGHPLFPIMPYTNFRQIDSNDIIAAIAYIRTLPPIENTTEKSSTDFPMNFIIHTIPKKPAFQPVPSKSDKVAYGAYMVTAANCKECHTKFENGKFTGVPFAGGREFPLPNGTLRTPNLTPHSTGLGNWTEETFIQRFKMYSDSTYVPIKPEDLGYQTYMPWMNYTHMTTEDLSAIYAYLRSVPAVANKVEKFTAMK